MLKKNRLKKKNLTKVIYNFNKLVKFKVIKYQNQGGEYDYFPMGAQKGEIAI